MSKSTSLNKRQERAFHEGRMGFRMGIDIGLCPLRSPSQRQVWRDGFEHERRMDLAEKITPKERAEAVSVAGRLGDWARQQLGAKV
jgi:ribosome modulation factor